AGATVYITSGSGCCNYGGTTDGDGHVPINNVVEGPFSVYAYDGDTGGFAGSNKGGIQSTDAGAPVEITVAPAIGTISGVLTGGDGTTPIPFTEVDLYDDSTGSGGGGGGG